MTRLVSGVALAAAALAAILFLPFLALRIVTCAVAGLAAYEYLKIVHGDALILGAVVITCFVVSGSSVSALAVIWILLFLGVAGPVMWRNASVQSAAAAAFAIVYVGVPLGMLAAVHRLYGARLTLLIIATIAVSDSAQYYTGRAFGRRPLAPTISPKKTIEGAVGGVVFGTAFLVAAGAYLFALPLQTLIPFGLLVVALGIIGDLFESRLKRTAGVKDSSMLIPGHGGVLDRIDALLFAAPAFFFYFTRS